MAGTGINTNWVKKYSFPLFLYNALQVLGNARDSAGEEVHRPAQPVQIRPETIGDTIEVAGPDGRAETLKRSPQGTFVYNDANATGLYHVKWPPSGAVTFAVNQFDPRESDLAPRGLVPEGTPADQADRYKIKIGFNPVNSTRKVVAAPRDWWKAAALAGAGDRAGRVVHLQPARLHLTSPVWVPHVEVSRGADFDNPLPAEVEERVLGEVEPGESVVWVGRPASGRFFLSMLPVLVFGVPWTAFSLFWVVMAIAASPPGAMAIIFPLFGLPFVAIGAGMLGGALLGAAASGAGGVRRHGSPRDLLRAQLPDGPEGRQPAAGRDSARSSESSARDGSGDLTFGVPLAVQTRPNATTSWPASSSASLRSATSSP